jgi:alpha-amylase
VHQPYRVKKLSFFDVGKGHNYFDHQSDGDLNNRSIVDKVKGKCYLPANQMWLESLERHPELKLAFSISGVALDQFEEYAPEVLASFRRLVDTGRVELISETYHHSLAFLKSEREFREQVGLHRKRLFDTFGVVPSVFRNTELIYRNDIGRMVADMGYRGMLTEGWDHYLGWRSPNFLYHGTEAPELALLLKNYKLSDDVAFRFSDRGWTEYPLSAERFGSWVNAVNGSGQLVNLFMDYETMGEHHWEDTGIFDFWRALPGEILKHPDNDFVTPTEAVTRFDPVGDYDVPHYLSWADMERDITAWIGNPIQHDALRVLYELEDEVREVGDAALLADWRRLQTSDHFYYMCTKYWSDGDVHAYFSPYQSPYEAFIAYMNAINDFRVRLTDAKEARAVPSPITEAEARIPAWKARLHQLFFPEYHY